MRFHLATSFVDVDQVMALVGPAEEMGWHGMYVSDHLFFPRDLQSKYTYTPDGAPFWTPEHHWPDPWCLISAMAARTREMVFTTGVYIAPARDLITVAKLVGTAAVISGDRVHLGLAAGWCREEFDATGQDFDSRGKRLDDMIPALRALWAGGWVEHHGPHYDVPAMKMSPSPAKPIPILPGGLTKVAMRRAATVGDGWISGPAYTLDDMWANVRAIQDLVHEAGRDGEDFRIYTPVPAMASVELYRDVAEAGVTDVIMAPWLQVPGGSYEMDLPGKLRAAEKLATDILQKL